MRKIIIYILVFIITAITQQLTAQKERPKLAISGEFISNGKSLEGVIVKVYLDSVNIQTHVANRYGKFFMYLDYMKIFELEFSKKGFITQKIEFSTKLPKSAYQRDGSSFFLKEEFEMFEMFPGLDITLFDGYFSRYKWNNEEYHFIKDGSYERKIKKEARLIKLRKEQTERRADLYSKRIKEADLFIKDSKYEEAGYLYTVASDLKPDDKYAKSKIKEVKKIIKSNNLIESGYNKAINKADDFFNKKELEKAKEAYLNASFYKEDEVYPIDQVAIIDSILAHQYLVVINTFEKAMKAGNEYMKKGEWIKAEAEFKRAKSILPEKNQPDIELKEIKIKIDEEKARMEAEASKEEELQQIKYEQLISMGDELCKQNKFEEALLKYNEADLVPNNDGKAKEKIKKVQNILSDQALYSEEIKKADQSFKDKDWTKAIAYYEKALKYNSDASYPKNQIEKIKKLISIDKETTQTNKNKVKEEKQQLEENEQEEIETDQLTNITSDSTATDDKMNIFALYLDKLRKSKEKGDRKEESKNLKSIGNIYHSEENLGKAIEYYQKSIKILEEEGDVENVTEVMGEMAVALFDSGLYENSIQQYEEAIELKDKVGDKQGISEYLDDIGIIYETTFQLDNALEFYKKSLHIKEETGDKNGESEVLNNIADVYYQQKELDLSLEHYKKSLDVTEEIGDVEKKGALMNDIGVTLYELGRYDEAIEYYMKSLDIKEKTENKKEVSMTLNNIGNVRLNWNDYSNAISYYEKSIALKEEIEYTVGLAISLYNIGNAYEKLKKFEKALNFYKRSEQEAVKSKADKRILSSVLSCISRVYKKMEQYKPAYEYQSKYIDLGVFDGKRNKLLTEKRDRFEEMKSKKEIKYLKRKIQRQKILADMQAAEKQKEIEIKNLELRNKVAELKKQRLLIYFFASVILLIAAVAVAIYKLFQNKKKANIELQEKNTLILDQSNQIRDSIMYASKIQNAAMPQPETMDKLLVDYFVFNKPQNIVSGDFYWLFEQDDKFVLAVADCTGHGVPGAMLCMLGISFLDEIIKGKKIKKPNKILEAMRGQVMELLHQKGEIFDLSDGIDMALCIFDKNRKYVDYSGANNPLYLVRDGVIQEYKADRMPVSYSYKTGEFSTQRIELQKNDIIYLFSDGYMDQIGGPRNTRMMRRRFKTLLESLYNESMEKQKEILDNYLKEWKGEKYIQVDDILILGVRI